MGILSINTSTTGQVGDAYAPHTTTMVTTDNIGTISTPGYLNGAQAQGYTFSPTDFVNVVYNYNTTTQAGDEGVFSVSLNHVNGLISLAPQFLKAQLLGYSFNNYLTLDSTTSLTPVISSMVSSYTPLSNNSTIVVMISTNYIAGSQGGSSTGRTMNLQIVRTAPTNLVLVNSQLGINLGAASTTGAAVGTATLFGIDVNNSFTTRTYAVYFYANDSNSNATLLNTNVGSPPTGPGSILIFEFSNS